jgi:hypothetical protein
MSTLAYDGGGVIISILVEKDGKDGKARSTKAFCNIRTVVGGLVVGSGGVYILPAIPG